MGVGLSILMGLKTLALLALFLCLRTIRFGLNIYPIPLLFSALISFLVSIASHPLINLPVLLGKKSDGSFPIWSKIMFSPYLVFVRCFCGLRRFTSREDPYTEVSQGLFVGGWPSSPRKLPPGEPAIVDCTCELPRRFELSKQGYFCIPTFDTRAPAPGDIEAAVKWACRKRAQDRAVFVHCAYGHGRSVAVMCALLVALGLAEDWKKAEIIIKEKRPYIKMNALQRKALEEWSRNRISTRRKN